MPEPAQRSSASWTLVHFLVHLLDDLSVTELDVGIRPGTGQGRAGTHAAREVGLET